MNNDAYKYIRYNATQETRWATVEEIQSSCTYIDLNDEDYPAGGLPILSDGKEAYVDSKDTHSLIFGATGSKKTRLFCMPMINIFAKAGESFIVTDPKGELYAQTSGLAKHKGYKVVVLNFRDIGLGDRWNPLSLPYSLWTQGNVDEAGMLLADVAYALAAPMAKDAKDPYWPEAAQQLAVAALYTIMEAAKPEEVNMKSFAKLISYGNLDNLKTLTKMLDEDSIAHMNFSSTIGISATNTISGIVATLFGMLRMFCTNDKLASMLSTTTFDLKKIGREKTAVYLIVPDEKTTYHALVTMFVKQAYEVLINEAQKEPTRQLPIRVNFVLDEFCNIPKIPDMPAMISAARSRNMRYYLVAQSLHQLKGRYGDDADTIKGNCDNWVFLTSREIALLTEISNLCGKIKPANADSRALISVSELQRFSKERGEALILHCRNCPIISPMADISQYKMFGIYDPVPFEVQRLEDTTSFSLPTFLEMIKKGEAVAPFPSYKHKIKQAKKIYSKYMKIADPDYVEVGEAPRRRPWGLPSEPEKKAKDKGVSSAEVLARVNEAHKTIRERITELMGVAFADRFYDEKLYNTDTSDDDDYDSW